MSKILTLFPKYIPFHCGGGGGSKTSARICPSRYIRTSEAFSQHGRLPLGEIFCEFSIKKRHEHILKMLHF